MAKLDPNTIIGILQGKLGNLVFSRMKNGQVNVRRKPVRHAAATSRELLNRSRFEAAVRYVRRIGQDPALYGPYQAAAKVTGKRARDLAHADFWHPPSVRDIDFVSYTGHASDSILIDAVDDFEVVRVRVTIAALDGTVLEEDEAHFDPSVSQWRYLALEEIAPGQTVVVHITALDRPGNVGIKSVHHALAVSFEHTH
jgi:hypothetical protein